MITARHVNYYKEKTYYKKYKTLGTIFETIDRPDIHVADAHPRYVTTFDKSKNQGYGGYIFQQRNSLYASSYTFWANTDSGTSENGAFIFVGSGNYGNGVALGVGDSNGFGSTGTDIILVIDGYNVVVCGTKPTGWHHYGLVLEDDYNIHVYVDGQLFYTANEYTSLYNQPYTFVIGNSGLPNEVYDNSGAYDNSIARVCVWNKTLSQSEVEDDYDMGQTSPTFQESGLYAYYSMCPVGDVLHDFAGRAGLQSDKMTWTYDTTSENVVPGAAPAIVDGVIYPPSFSYNNTGYITGCYKVLDSFSPNGKSWEYVADFETPEDLESYGEPFCAGIFGGFGTADGCTPIYMQVSTDGQNKKLLTAFLSSNGTQWDISNQTITQVLIVQPSTRYKIKAIYDQTKYQWFRWNFTTEEWELQFTLNDSRAVYDGLAMQLGTNRGRNDGFGGIIYVKNCYIKVNDCYVWRGDAYGLGCELTAFGEPQAEEVNWGNVTVPNPISGGYPVTLAKTMYYDYPLYVKNATAPNGGAFNVFGGNFDLWNDIVTDWATYFNSTTSITGTTLPSDGQFECGSGKYITLNNTSMTPSTNTWEIGMKFYTSQQNPGGVLWGYNRGAGGTRHRNTQIYLGNNSIGICISTDGTSWATYGSASYTLEPQRWVWIKFIYDGEKYVLKVSYDNETWQDWITYNSSMPIYGFYDTSLCAGDNGNMMSAPPYCTVDLKECYLKIADEYVWRGDNTVIAPIEYPATEVHFAQNVTADYVNLLSYDLKEIECGYDDPDATTEVQQGTHNVLSTSGDYDISEVEDKYYEVEND